MGWGGHWCSRVWTQRLRWKWRPPLYLQNSLNHDGLLSFLLRSEGLLLWIPSENFNLYQIYSSEYSKINDQFLTNGSGILIHESLAIQESGWRYEELFSFYIKTLHQVSFPHCQQLPQEFFSLSFCFEIGCADTDKLPSYIGHCWRSLAHAQK